MLYEILLVDDEENILKSLTRVLGPSNYSITSCQKPLAALELLKNNNYHLVISDQRMPAMLGTELLKHVDELQPQTRRILMSAHADFTEITAGFNADSIHQFISKPCESTVLREVVNTQLEIYQQAITDEQEELEKNQDSLVNTSSTIDQDGDVDATIFHGIVSADPVMFELTNFVRKVANFGAPFFIHGETGTGKELFARAIHREGPRSEQPFLAFNCANLTENLLESQLFGHIKGAFTGADKDQQGLFAAAEKGTLFLDEVVEIPLNLQAKLLRVLQEKEFTPLGQTKPVKFDLQIISASSLSFKDAVEQGLFRDDLRYRLEVMPISIPPLRARKGDIKPLFNYLLQQQFDEAVLPNIDISEEVYHYIEAYSWPGNVRELVNACTYIAAMAMSNMNDVSIACLPEKIVRPELVVPTSSAANSAVQAEMPRQMNAVEKELDAASLTQLLAGFAGNKTATASYLGISRMTLWRKMKKLDLL